MVLIVHRSEIYCIGFNSQISIYLSIYLHIYLSMYLWSVWTYTIPIVYAINQLPVHTYPNQLILKFIHPSNHPSFYPSWIYFDYKYCEYCLLCVSIVTLLSPGVQYPDPCLSSIIQSYSIHASIHPLLHLSICRTWWWG